MALQTMQHPPQHQHHHRSRPTSIMPPTSFHTHTASDSMSARSSSETTAAGIFSMYEDPGTPPPNAKAPPVPALDPRLRYTQTSSRPVSTASRPMSTATRPSIEAEYRARSGSRPLSEMSGGDGYEAAPRQRPGRSAEMGSPAKGGIVVGPPVSYGGHVDGRKSAASRRSYTQDGRSSLAYDGLPNSRASITQPPYPTPPSSNQESTYPARRSSLQHLTDSLGTNGQPNTPSRAALKPLPPSRTPSPHIAMLAPSTSQVEQISITIPQGSSSGAGGSAVSQHSNPSADLLTPIGDRERRTSSKHSMQTTQTTQTSHTEYTTRGSTEDVDAYRVRATYAKLEAEGVYGDGWMEGVERTRTRIMSAGSVALLEASKGAGGKGADVSKDEEARLRSTDRYGFFNTPTPKHEDRLALLPTAAFRQLPSTSKQPAIPTPPNAIPPLPQINHIPSPTTDPRENYRISKWERMLVPASTPGSGGSGGGGGSGSIGWKWDSRKVKKRTERVFKGIPDRWRSAAWGTLVEERMVRPSERRTERVSAGELGRRYRDLLDQPSEHDVQIDLDVPRTISGHVMFHTRYGQGQRSLFYVLHAFSLLCPSCGYVQGMGPIAATLLNYFEPERTYAALVRLHDEYAMHTIFQPGFPGLLESIYVQERLVERTMPGVYQALSKNMISSTSFVTKWYITLFANTVPFQTQLRLWDAFLLEGRDVLVVTAVAILWVVKDQISAAQANFETILSLLSSTFVIEDEDAMMHWMERILGDRKVREEMDGWRADWGRLVAEGKSGTALL